MNRVCDTCHSMTKYPNTPKRGIHLTQAARRRWRHHAAVALCRRGVACRRPQVWPEAVHGCGLRQAEPLQLASSGYPNTQRNPNDETPNIGTSGHSADRCHGSPHALNQTSLLSSIDLAEDQVEFLYRLPKQRRSLFQVAGFSCSRLVVATFFPRHCPSSTTTFGLGYFVIPWVFGCFVICHLWRSFIPCCLSQTRLTKRHSRLKLCRRVLRRDR